MNCRLLLSDPLNPLFSKKTEQWRDSGSDKTRPADKQDKQPRGLRQNDGEQAESSSHMLIINPTTRQQQQHHRYYTSCRSLLPITKHRAREKPLTFDLRRHPLYTDQPKRVHGASSSDACTVGPYRLPWSSKARRCPHFTNYRHVSAVVPAYLYDTFELWDRHRPRSEINGQNTPHELLFPPPITAMATAVL